MGNQILSWGVNVPTVGPRSHTERNLFSHEEPWHEWIKRNVTQKFGPRKEETRRNERNLGGPWFIPLVGKSSIDSHNRVWIVSACATSAETSTVRFMHPTIICCVKARWIRAQNRLWVIPRCLNLYPIFFVPVLGKHEMGIALHKVCLTTPQLGCKVSGYRRSERFGFVHVNHAYLSVLTIPFVTRYGTKCLNTIGIWGTIINLLID